jgi:hypothetical protein
VMHVQVTKFAMPKLARLRHIHADVCHDSGMHSGAFLHRGRTTCGIATHGYWFAPNGWHGSSEGRWIMSEGTCSSHCEAEPAASSLPPEPIVELRYLLAHFHDLHASDPHRLAAILDRTADCLDLMAARTERNGTEASCVGTTSLVHEPRCLLWR